MRLHRPHVAPAREPVQFTFDGIPTSALPGESIAAALAASGIAAMRSLGSGQAAGGGWRGPYCGMGACFDCLVTIDGRVSQRACLAKVSGGEMVRSAPPSGAWDDPLRPLAAFPRGSQLEEVATDVLVVGAGPAGLAAALAARRRGARVVVLDERPQSGGQYYKPIASSLKADRPPDEQFRKGKMLVQAVLSAGADIVQGALVWGAFGADDVLALVDGKAMVFKPRRLILATGAYERPAPMPGWTLPGVMATGAAQTLVRSYGVLPGKRIVIAGNGPLNLQLAAELVEHGVKVAAVVESASRPTPYRLRDLATAALNAPGLMAEGARYLWRLRRAGVPVLWSHMARAATGQNRVTAVQIAPVGADGIPDPARAAWLDADAVCLGYGFIASSEIARSLGCDMQLDARHLGTHSVAVSDTGESSVAGVFVVGDGAKVAGARSAEASGTIAGAAAAAQLGLSVADTKDVAEATRDLARARAFQTALWRLYAAPPVRLDHIDDSTILCRCETVSFGKVRSEIRSGWDSLATLKRRTRLGMGRCQGRYCTPVAGLLLSDMTGRPRGLTDAFAPRLPAKPFPAAALAIEKPEWGGHLRASSPDLSRPVDEKPLGDHSADVVVIGGGVVGTCLAYYLAKSGQDVIVVERDDINLQASGANAGSLHVQLLSFDFGRKAEGGGGPAAATLPLGPWAVELWQELARICGGDFEIRITGGLMVAETEAGMVFLRAKAALERSHGIEAEILGRKELRDLAPALSDRLIGAEYAPQEGKINPLTATFRVFEQARANGARYWRSANVQALDRNMSGWEVTTSRGRIRAGKVVNAAGPWARKVGSMAGMDLPVYSAPLQMITTESAPALVGQLIAHADRHLSLKQLSTGGILIGGAWTAQYNAMQRMNATVRNSIEGNLWVAQQVIPQISGLHVLRSWAGMNVNIDGAPIVGEAPGAPGFFNCVTSNGYTLAPAVARLTADIILTGQASKDVRPYLLDRFG